MTTVVTMQGGVPGQAVVVGQPAAGGPQIIGSVKGHRQWSTGLLDCFSDVKGCLMTMLCMPCALCDISSRLGDCSCMPLCIPDSLLAMRTRTRTLGGIQGSICNDCLVIAFCAECAVCQMKRELDNMGL